MYGTEDQLIKMVQTAHRFGIRVYFDNVMNHRSSTVPGYPGSGTPTNYYPGLRPQDFHLQVVSGGYKNWPSIGDPYWCTTSVVEDQPLLGLSDLAQEPGTNNLNFGANVGNTTLKPVFIRFPGPVGFVHGHQWSFVGRGLGHRLAIAGERIWAVERMASLRRQWPAGAGRCVHLSLPRGGVDALHDQVRRLPAGRGEARAGELLRQ